MSPHEKMKQIGDTKPVYMMLSKFGFRSEKCINDWHQLSSLITGWICQKFHEMAGHSDLSERGQTQGFKNLYFAIFNHC